MTTEDTRQFMERYIATLSGGPKSPDLVDEWVSDESLKEHIAMFEAAFPGYDLRFDEMVVEGDRVGVRATFAGTHGGEFQGIPATGREVTLPVMIFYRVEDGKIAQFSMSADSLSLLTQLGAAPAPV